MRAKSRTLRMVAFAAAALLGIAVLPSALAASESPPWVGSYWGTIQSGGDTTPARIWVQSTDGQTARVSVQVAGLPVLESTGMVYKGGQGEVNIRLDFASAGVGVATNIYLTPASGEYDIWGEGNGSVFGNTGKGEVTARQYTEYIEMPPLADQMVGTVNALLGRPDRPYGFPDKGPSAPPPASPIQPYENRPPLGLADLLAMEWILSLLSLFLFAV